MGEGRASTTSSITFPLVKVVQKGSSVTKEICAGDSWDSLQDRPRVPAVLCQSSCHLFLLEKSKRDITRNRDGVWSKSLNAQTDQLGLRGAEGACESALCRLPLTALFLASAGRLWAEGGLGCAWL